MTRTRGAAAEPADASRPARPSRARYLLLFFLGLFIGRLASNNFASGPLELLDLVMYVGLAFCIAWAWRSWARQAFQRRHVEAQRRRPRPD